MITSQKRLDRKEQFKILGQRISATPRGERDYHTGKPIAGTWQGQSSIEPTKDKPIIGGPQHRVMQFLKYGA